MRVKTLKVIKNSYVAMVNSFNNRNTIYVYWIFSDGLIWLISSASEFFCLKELLLTNITGSEMKKMLLLCTKSVHFSYNQDIYIQKDGVATGSPLRHVLAGIFMVNLERRLALKINVYINFWRRHVDVAITFVKIGSAEYLLSVLNNFQPKIKFTYEKWKSNFKVEWKSKLALLDILLHRDGNDI